MKILFICTHNRCRSILSEAITNHLAAPGITAISAGSQPAGQVHPLSLKYLAEKGIATDGLKSQSWNDFESQRPDIVVTVCDSAANEPCPVWFGDCVQVHWGLPDPSKLDADEPAVRAAFFQVMATIEQRIQALQALKLESIPRHEWSAKLKQIAETVN